MDTRLGPEAYSALLDAAPDGVVVVDDHGVIVYTNDQTATLFGYARAELVGSRVETLLPEAVRAVHVGHRDAFARSPHRRPMGSGLDLVGRRKDGSEFPVEISLSPLQTEDGLLVTAIVRDVSARRRMERALRASEERYRLLAENAHDIIYKLALVGDVLRVDFVSPSVAVTGHAPDEFYGDADLIFAVTHPDDRALLRAALSDPAAQDGPLTLRLAVDDGPVWLEHRLRAVLGPAGELRGVEGIARDITERVRAEEERRLLLADAEMQRERERIAADLHDGVMQSIYGVGLSLRQVGAGIEGAAPEVRERIDEAIQELATAIADIRRYVMDLRPVRFTGDLAESLANVARLFEAASLIPTTVEIDVPAGAVDEDGALAVFHVAREALSNIRRHAQATAVTIVLRGVGSDLVLRVGDDGAGFDVATAQGAEGHFGLQNMALRARASAGRLRIESAPGAGTTVELTVPGAG